jgi:hypothetical protein
VLESRVRRAHSRSSRSSCLSLSLSLSMGIFFWMNIANKASEEKEGEHEL